MSQTGFKIEYRVPKGMQSLKNDDIFGTAANSRLFTQNLIKNRTQDVNDKFFNSSSMYGHFYGYDGQKVKGHYELADLRSKTQPIKSTKSASDLTYKDFIDKNRAQRVLSKEKINLHGI